MQDVILVALAKVARRGDMDVLVVVQALVKDPLGSHFALSTYAKLAQHNDDEVIMALLSRAQDPNENVRGVAVIALSRLSTC